MLLASHTGSGKTLAYLLPVVQLLPFIATALCVPGQHTCRHCHGWCCTSDSHMCDMVAGEAPQRCGGAQRGEGQAQEAPRHCAGTHKGADRSNPGSGQVDEPLCQIQICLRERRSARTLPSRQSRPCLLPAGLPCSCGCHRSMSLHASMTSAVHNAPLDLDMPTPRMSMIRQNAHTENRWQPLVTAVLRRLGGCEWPGCPWQVARLGSRARCLPSHWTS